MLEKLFHLKEKGTTVRTEIVAGLTTFLAMAYILAVNPSILSAAGMDPNAVFMATAVSSAFATVLMGVLANYPVALAPGMGVNALFAYTICLGMGHTWQMALCAVFVSGIIFLVISVTGIRKAIINAIPVQLKYAIGAGIGFFIAFIGLKNAEIIVADPATFVALGDFANPTVLLALIGIVITLVLVIQKVPAGVFLGMVVTGILGVVMGKMGIANMPTLPLAGAINTDFTISTFGAFAQGFGELFESPVTAVIIIFSFLFVDFFDTAGTLIAVGNGCGLVSEDGEMENIEKALLADATGTVVGAVMGTSTVTSFVESTSGVGVGGRTGLTAVTTGVCFLLSVLISPIVLSFATNAVTAPALFIVGVMMAGQLKDIKWGDFKIAAAAFVTIIVMILAYSISDGIALGFITYAVGMIAEGKAKQINPIIAVLVIVFLLYFAFV